MSIDYLIRYDHDNLQNIINSQSNKKTSKSDEDYMKTKINTQLSSKESHVPPANERVSNNPKPPSTSSNQNSNIFMSQKRPMGIENISNRKHPHSLLEVDDLVNRVVCVNRKLTIVGSSHEAEAFSTYYANSLERDKSDCYENAYSSAKIETNETNMNDNLT